LVNYYVFMESERTGLYFGFNNLADFTEGLVGVKSIRMQFLFSIPTGAYAFFTDYLYDDLRSYVVLLSVMLFDWFTGWAYATKSKTYLSRINYRMPIYIFMTSAILFMSHNMALSNIAYAPLPGTLYGGFLAIYFSSVLENVGKLEWLPPGISKFLAQYAGLKSLGKFIDTKFGDSIAESAPITIEKNDKKD